MNDDSPYKFRPKARILRLLGDELIGNQRLAIFELVKNAYDADAEEVVVTLAGLGTPGASITVRDDGDGMGETTIRDVWFVPGADHRDRQRKEGRRSERFNRLPLGEKGLGRFAVHKLGERIRLVTRAIDDPVERVVEIDWDKILGDGYLEDLQLQVTKREPITFPGSTHGTEVVIEGLRQDEWTRGDLRRLYRQVTSICSPFTAEREFSVELKLPGREADLSGLPTVGEILRKALWHYTFSLDEQGRFTWTYEFINRLVGADLADRTVSGTLESLQLDDQADEAAEEAMTRKQRRGRESKSVVVDADFLKGIGPLEGEFFVFDRDKEVLARMAESDLMTRYLNENGGIRVYRDAIRVYNYGERGDDWLGLDLRRVNQPTMRVSRNVVLAAINLSLEHSTELLEKTNREGFVESDAYRRLRRIVLASLAALEAERQSDKDRLRQILGKKGGIERFDASPPFQALRREAKRIHADKELEPFINRIEAEFEALKDTVVHVGFSGIGLAVVFHEIDRGIRELLAAFKAGGERPALERKAMDLSLLLDGFSTLLRRSGRKPMRASELIRQARDISVARFRYHQVALHCPVLDDPSQDFEAVMARELMVGALTNLIDNAIYWLRVRWPDLPDGEPLLRKIHIGTSLDVEGGPAIIVADNGPGFRDLPELLTKPFFTRRPDGMGMGLYYVKLAMELSGGSVQFPSAADVGLPEGYDGAVIALVFQNAKEVG
ncbi:MAG: ATP-binding protein [Xanthomonadales bacterium]|nr:ATP-binding protein [Xanthomonadales bacterium]